MGKEDKMERPKRLPIRQLIIAPLIACTWLALCLFVCLGGILLLCKLLGSNMTYQQICQILLFLASAYVFFMFLAVVYTVVKYLLKPTRIQEIEEKPR